MTPEQIANNRLAQEAWDHLSTTKVKSLDPETGDCRYSGTGCAFSPALLPKERKKTVNLAASNYLGMFPDALQPWAREVTSGFADRVQEAHDYAPDEEAFLNEFAHQLDAVCRRFEVKVPDGLDEYLESTKFSSQSTGEVS